MPISLSLYDLRARLLAGLGMVALIVQLIATGFANAAGGEWIVICTGQGPMLVQVDFDADDSAPPPSHQGCGNCIFCASYGAALPGLVKTGLGDGPFVCRAVPSVVTLAVPSIAHLRPQTRGPPRAEELKFAPIPGEFTALYEGVVPWI